jgi:hypothetical protein
MKKFVIILICILISGVSAIAQFAINTDDSNPDNSAMLDVKSATKGVLIPRMTFTERDAIVNPANGLMVYCTNCGIDGSLSIYSNGVWRTFAPCNNTGPVAGTHVPSNTSIIWNWNPVPDALGYKWSMTNNYANAIDVGVAISKNETGLSCGNNYTRFLWAYNSCGVSAAVSLTQSTSGTISTPVAGIPVPDLSSVIWNWNIVSGADGYKWGTTNNYANAVDMGTAISKVETGLPCSTPLTRYVWAYNSCAYSTPVALTSSTTAEPVTPASGTHIADCSSMIWNWTPVANAIGYKWNTTNDFSSATDMSTATSKTETNLIYGTAYTRYVWAYNTCGHSAPVTLTGSTLPAPASPAAGSSEATINSIEWEWDIVPGPDVHYKWNTTNNYSTAIDLFHATTYVETGLACGTAYSRYVWAYNECGPSNPVTLTQSTLVCPVCGDPITINHLASGGVAPVDKTVTYGTITNVPGEASKCWITRNLGATNQATTVSDATEAASGWYWQFNRKQGYKHDGTTRTPNTTWITAISENFDWLAGNDPCALEIGSGWRVPTKTEWTDVDATTGGNWTNWNGPFTLLKIHAAGTLIYSTGAVSYRGSSGSYWSGNGYSTLQTNAYQLSFTSTTCGIGLTNKAYGNPVRCVHD